ncbi:MAG: hypothetical protein GY749_05280, partial [Desulfobacteraceae bacterium]|nr:hypothetical protein [Desulfobacteraceae bacterium]
MSWKNDQLRLASVLLLSVTFIIGAVAMESVAYAQGVYEYFAGDTNVPNATVQINETVAKTNEDGSFGFYTKRAEEEDSYQYAISVSKPGYALASRIEQWPSISLSFTLKEADIIVISENDHANGITVTDTSNTQIKLPANAFGNSVNEPINAYLYTYDLGNEQMPGDMTV